MAAHPPHDVGRRTVHAERQNTSTPESGTYQIENKWVHLTDGRAETETIIGSLSKSVTTLFSQPIYGDLDGNNEADAALLLVRQEGGSGTFVYVSSALNVGGDYQGTNAVFLGDRIAPQSVEIRSGSIIVLYKDRRADEAMVTMPLISKTKRLSFEAGRLKEIFPADEDNQLEQGWVTIGHEVRSFLPCRKTEQHWLLGDSPALPEIMATYQQALSDFPPYPPLFMMLAGVSAPLPEDGFGNDYETAFRANQLVEADPQGHCRSEFIVVESPAPSQHINASIKVGGKARGSWYFEGDFPLLLTNAAGQVLAQGFATAQSPWMTNEWVPFTGVLGLYLKEGG